MKTTIGHAVAPARTSMLAILVLSISGCGPGVPPRQTADTIGDPPSTPGAIARYETDPARRRIWALTAEGASAHEIDAPESIDVPLPGWQWVDAPYGCLPALALGPDGEALVTSNVTPTLWRIDPASLAVTAHALALDADTSRDIGFSTLVYSPAHDAYFAVSEVHGSLWRIDRSIARARKLALSGPLPRWCGASLRHLTAEATGQPARLCLSVREGSRTIDLAADASSAVVTASPCADTQRETVMP